MDNKRFNSLRESAFFYSLLLTVLVFPFSEALVSIASGLMLVQALLLQSWKHPHFNRHNTADLLAIFAIFGIYLAGTIFTHDSDLALYELKKVIFWIIIPAAFYLSPPIDERKTYTVLMTFVFSVFAGSLVFTGKLLMHDNLLTQEVRTIGIISNIRFSFQVILSLILLAWFMYNKKSLNHRRFFYINAAVFVWLTLFLFFLQSLLGIISFLGTISVVSVYYLFKIEKRFLKAALLISVAAVLI